MFGFAAPGVEIYVKPKKWTLYPNISFKLVISCECILNYTLCIRSGVTVLNEEHSDEGADYEDCTEGEEYVSHTEDIVEEARENGSNDLRRHGGLSLIHI